MMREIEKLPSGSSGYYGVSIITDGTDLRAEYEFNPSDHHEVGAIEFYGVRCSRVWSHRTYPKDAPRANILWEVEEEDKTFFLIWFYEDVILEVEAEGFKIAPPISAHFPQDFGEWRVARQAAVDENTGDLVSS